MPADYLLDLKQRVEGDQDQGATPDSEGMADIEDWRADLKAALKCISEKRPKVSLNWRYYEGNHPRKWLTEQVRETFEGQDFAFDEGDNWCELAVDACLKRLFVTGWNAAKEGNETVTEAIDKVMAENNLKLEQTDIYRHVRVAGEAFLFAWRVEGDPKRPSGYDISLNDARNVYWPEDADRDNPRVVVKVFVDTEPTEEGYSKFWRATVYYRLNQVRLRGPKVNDAETLPTNLRYFEEDSKDPGGPHGFDRPPVVRFALGRKPRSVISNIRPQQDKINKLEANKMVAAEWGAFQKLLILTKQQIGDGDVQPRPNRPVVLDPGSKDDHPTKVQEVTATELSNYDDSIAKEIDKLFSKSHLPSHMKVKTADSGGTAPSGAEREADEGDFIEDIRNMQRVFEESWKDLWRLIFGDEADIKAAWNNPVMKSDKDEVDTLTSAKTAGIPIEIALKHYSSWDKDDIDELVNRPLSPEEAMAAMGNVAKAAALGGIDPGQAQQFNAKLMGQGGVQNASAQKGLTGQ